MAETRRPLVEGLKFAGSNPGVDTSLEKAFVFGSKPEPTPEKPTSQQPSSPVQGDLPMSTRIRGDFVTAIKRASLERQLSGTEPSTIKDILEQALEPWLKEHGYLA
jgi:hypothetical protein